MTAPPLTPEQIQALFAPRPRQPHVLTAADVALRARSVVPCLPPPEYAELDTRAEYPTSTRGVWLRAQHALNPLCAYCGNRTGLGPDHWLLQATVDHRKPVARGGKDHASNWVLACKLCNMAKADGEYTHEKRRILLARINARRSSGAT